MIKERLAKDLKLNRLFNTYLVSTDNLEAARDEILDFLGDNLYPGRQVIGHPDFMMVQREPGFKDIAIEQIRNLQEELNKTSIISGRKTAIIYAAEQMNVNAANCCLKMLEEAPRDNYIFLITAKTELILPTIRSRCAKISHCSFTELDKPVDDYYIKPLLKSAKIDEQLSYLKIFAEKDRDSWAEFTTSAQQLLARACSSLVGHVVKLSPLEKQFMEQQKAVSLKQLAKKYERVVKLTEDTLNFDLDLRASYILLVDIVS